MIDILDILAREFEVEFPGLTITRVKASGFTEELQFALNQTFIIISYLIIYPTEVCLYNRIIGGDGQSAGTWVDLHEPNSIERIIRYVRKNVRIASPHGHA